MNIRHRIEEWLFDLRIWPRSYRDRELAAIRLKNVASTHTITEKTSRTRETIRFHSDLGPTMDEGKVKAIMVRIQRTPNPPVTTGDTNASDSNPTPHQNENT